MCVCSCTFEVTTVNQINSTDVINSHIVKTYSLFWIYSGLYWKSNLLFNQIFFFFFHTLNLNIFLWKWEIFVNFAYVCITRLTTINWRPTYVSKCFHFSNTAFVKKWLISEYIQKSHNFKMKNNFVTFSLLQRLYKTDSCSTEYTFISVWVSASVCVDWWRKPKEWGKSNTSHPTRNAKAITHKKKPLNILLFSSNVFLYDDIFTEIKKTFECSCLCEREFALRLVWIYWRWLRNEVKATPCTFHYPLTKWLHSDYYDFVHNSLLIIIFHFWFMSLQIND